MLDITHYDINNNVHIYEELIMLSITCYYINNDTHIYEESLSHVITLIMICTFMKN